jgi:hypothetical protein
MSFYQKYLKYKNKYIQLKQIGGANYDADICVKTVTKDTINIGDKIKFRSSEHEINFSIIDNYGDGLRLKSVETINDNPVLELSIWKDNNKCKLNFIRGGHDILKFKVLRHFFSCIAAYFECNIMVLEDDAHFKQSDDITFRGLTYRIITGKESIYKDDEFGFNITTIDLKDNDAFRAVDLPYDLNKYNSDRELIIASKLTTFKELLIVYKTEKNLVYLLNRVTKPFLMKPLIIDDVEEIIKLIDDFIALNSREVLFSNYISRLNHVDVPIFEKEKIKKLLDILIENPHSVSITYKEFCNTNQIYGAIRRIFYAHQNMESRKVVCTLCPRAAE